MSTATDNPQTALVPVERGKEMLLSGPDNSISLIFGERPQFYSSLNSANPEERKTLFRCSQGFDINAADHPGVVFDLQHLYGERVEKATTKEGEVLDLLRLCLVTPSGTIIQTFSEEVRKSLSFLKTFFGVPPYNPPIRVKLVRYPSKHIGHFFKLESTDEPPTVGAIPANGNKRRNQA